MPIEMPCTSCGQKLRVGDEHAGKLARCPQCGTIVGVPGPDDTATSRAEPMSPPGDPSDWPAPAGPFPSSRQGENPFADRAEPARPIAVSPISRLRSARYQRPHRGGTILTLGIIGIPCCVICGILAWVMGASDLSQMRSGRMDPSGRGLTQAGMILGVVSTVLHGLAILAQILGATSGGL